MTPAEIEALVNLVVLGLQLLNNQLSKDDTPLTEEEKAAFKDRIKAAQLSVPDWE